MKKVIFIFLIICSASLFAQSEEALDRLYSEDQAGTMTTALLVLQATGVLPETAEESSAQYYLDSVPWGASVLEDGEYISNGGFSLLLMNAFELSSGIMYNFFPNKRYALKEMLYKGIIKGKPYGRDKISSFNVIYALSTLVEE